MVHLSKISASQVFVTLSEMALTDAPNYLWVFTNRTTNEEVRKVVLNDEDLSQYKERYNYFIIDASTEFDGKPSGQWSYIVYEIEDDIIDQVVDGLNILESGLMILTDAADNIFGVAHSTNNQFITR